MTFWHNVQWDGTIIKWVYVDEHALYSEADMETDSDVDQSTGVRRSQRLAEKRRKTRQWLESKELYF